MKEKSKRAWLVNAVYRLATSFCLTREYIKRVRDTLHMLCPVGEAGMRKLVVEVCLIVWGMEWLAFYALFVRSPGIYSFSVFCFYAVVIANEVLRFTAGRMERRVLRQTEKLLNDVRHYFYDTHSVVGALHEAAIVSGYEMQVHIDIILEVLSSEDVEAAVEEYNRISGNRFLKLFLSQCVAIQEYGDTENRGESVFVRNLSDLREDILNYLLQLERLQVEFAGLTFITLVPLLLLPAIRTTVIEMLPELSGFYGGTIGHILPVLFLVGTIAVYGIIVEMQELDAHSHTNKLLRTLDKNRYISAVLNCWEKRNYGRMIQQERKLRCAGEMIPARLFFLEKVLYMGATVALGIVVLVWAKKGRTGILWYECIVLLICGMGAYFLPNVRVCYRKSLMRMNMLSEVTLFQSIIMMQMFIPDITVLRILTMLEQFAYIFRASIQDCINEYSYSVKSALQGMKSAEHYEPFRRLCDNLLTVDKIGIVRSFEEIVQDRMHFQKQRDADTYRMIKKKSDYAKMIAFIPMLSIMITYLILPYGIEAVRQFSLILEDLSRV